MQPSLNAQLNAGAENVGYHMKENPPQLGTQYLTDQNSSIKGGKYQMPQQVNNTC